MCVYTGSEVTEVPRSDPSRIFSEQNYQLARGNAKAEAHGRRTAVYPQENMALVFIPFAL